MTSLSESEKDLFHAYARSCIEHVWMPFWRPSWEPVSLDNALLAVKMPEDLHISWGGWRLRPAVQHQIQYEFLITFSQYAHGGWATLSKEKQQEFRSLASQSDDFQLGVQKFHVSVLSFLRTPKSRHLIQALCSAHQ